MSVRLIFPALLRTVYFHSGEKRKGHNFNNIEKESKRKKMDYMRLLLSPITMDDRMHRLTEQGYSMTFNPSKDGNCQFSALAYALSKYGIFHSPTTLRYEVVEYLRNNPTMQRDFLWIFF